MCKCMWSPKHDKEAGGENVVTGVVDTYGLEGGGSSSTMTNLFTSRSCENIAVRVSNLLHAAL